MPVKQKYTTMRPLLYTSIVLLFLSSCITSSHVHYSDPNYLGSSEFSSYEEIVTEPVSEIAIYQTQDTDTITDNYYSEYDVADDYYDYSFSSRIRRFHRPMYYSNYYGGLYTDYYWYNNDPFYCGTSIYYGYNWNSPYYSYYSYSPYYYNNYNSYYAYGHNNYHHNTPTYTYYNNNNNHTTGHRGSLSSHSSGRGVKTNTIIPNTNVNTSTLNIRNGNTLKNNTNSTIRNTSITTKPYRGNTTIKTGNSRGNTSTKTNNSYRGNTSNKTTTKKGNHSYTTPKSNTNKKSYSAPKSNSSKRNYNSGSSKSNRGSKSSGNSNRRSTKPRK
jgi:hypothetical protein